MKKGLVVLCLCLLTACNGYSLVKKEQTSIEGISLMPRGQWNAAPANFSFRGVPTWTADGAFLNSIMFFPKVAEGETLVKAQDKEQYPVYEANMLPNEIMDLTKSTIAKMYSTTIADEGEIAPFRTQAGMGFQFSFAFADQDGLTHQVLATAVVKDSLLNLVVYQAAGMYYYDKDLANVKNMMATLDVI